MRDVHIISAVFIFSLGVLLILRFTTDRSRKTLDLKQFVSCLRTRVHPFLAHGCLDDITILVKQTGADAVLHSGDFGFYDHDHESADRLTHRELRLRIVHSYL